jgi:uncharacterized protein (TIGR02996 family)
MSDETAFLNKLLELPADDNTRLIYADWLEEQDNPAARHKAQFLRLLTAPTASAESARESELQTMAQELDPIWLAIVSKSRIENCRSDGLTVRQGRWPFRTQREIVCPKKWEELTATQTQTVRHCGQCQKLVYHCRSIEEARDHVSQAHCISLALVVERSPGDL